MSKKESSLGEKILLSVLMIVLTVLVILFGAVFLSDNPEWTVTHLGMSKKEFAKYEALKFLGIGMGGVLLALQALMSYKRAKALEDTANAQAEAAKAQAKATEEQAKANQNTEQGQRQERLKNAIEHLGHPSDSVRLGGAYELFHLAEDKKDLRQTVLDILCAHIRRTTGESEYREKYKSKPSEEIQSLLTLLFVQKHEVFKGLHINLQGSWLNGADLREAHLEKAILTRIYIHRANLWKVEMQGAVLIEAQIQEAHLWGTQLQGANLWRAKMQGSDLSRARLQGANLFDAKMQGADLSLVQLQGADLRAAELQGASLCAAKMQGAALYGSRMQGIISSASGGFLPPFEELIKNRVGGGSDLNGIVFEGELSQEDLDSLAECLPAEKAKELQEKLKPHIGKSAIRELPKNSGAITGAYTLQEAEKWIAEHNKAMANIPKAETN